MPYGYGPGAAASSGVTNGDSHDHAGGDGAQIDHGGLAGLGDNDHTQYPVATLDTDGALTANSDTRVASQKAAKTYADGLIAAANALVYAGALDCSTNPNYPAADAGTLYVISVAGKIGGASGITVAVGDMALCKTDSTASGDEAAVGAQWNVIERNLDAASETVAGIVELATYAEIDTGEDAGRAICPDQFQASKRNLRYLVWRAVAVGTDTAAAEATVLERLPCPIAGVITNVYADNDTAGTTGTATYDIHLNGTTIMTTTKISIETTETSSRTATTPPALTTTAIAAGDLLTFHCDAVQSGTAAKGLVFTVVIRET